VIGPGGTLGRYRIEAVLGRGAMGEVYRAVDPAIGRTVAIKTVRIDAALVEVSREDLFERFRREARSAGRLKHHNIVAVYDYGEEAGLYWLVMELVEGVTLAQRIASTGAMPPEEACATAIQACAALGVAHFRGVVHRDIKPANLMIEAETGLVKVLDFGVARLDASELTRTGVVFGTPAYMSPEQILGRHVDHRSDLFSLGAVFYETLTGRKAFPGEHLATVTYHIVNDEPEGFAEIPARLGEGFAWVLSRALAKDPAQRFQSAGELADAIQTHALGAVPAPGWTQNVAGGTPPSGWSRAGTPPGGWLPTGTPPGGWTSAGPPGGWGPPGTPPGGWAPAPPARRRSRAPVLLGAGLVLAVAAGAGAWGLFGRSSRPERTGAASSPAADSAPAAAVPGPALEARLVLALDPPDAVATIDDSLEHAPGDTSVLAAGLHRVVVRAPGGATADTTLTLLAGEITTLTLALAPPEEPEAGTGTVSFVSNVPGQVLAGRQSLGRTPRRGIELAAGRHVLRFVPDAAAGLAIERRVDVPAGGSTTVAFEITQGFLSVAVREPRWARVYVDGASVGDTPVVQRPVSAGAHVVRVEREGYVPADRTVTVSPADHARWMDIRLEPQGGGR
jgi:serine/threonine-protein kinase